MPGTENVDIGANGDLPLLAPDCQTPCPVIHQREMQCYDAAAALANLGSERNREVFHALPQAQHAAGFVDGDIFELTTADSAMDGAVGDKDRGTDFARR